MDNKSIERIVQIMAYLYKYNAEFVLNMGEETCYLWFNSERQGELNYEELQCLLFNEIIELDGGCDEPGFETAVYRLTGQAKFRIKTILADNKKLRIKEKNNPFN